ncbi:MAG: septum formation initiator family protein [Dysgonamonadaceae bacterium]|jgi:cell division protein FtsB|nr:septum formation initiator family protein [Dysgonamonadaceae bacterium]
MKQFVLKIFSLAKNKLNKYWVTAIIFILVSFFMSENSIFKGFSYRWQIHQLKEDIEYHTKQKEENLQKLNALRSDNESLEKLAREQYRMVKPNEELFIIKE